MTPQYAGHPGEINGGPPQGRTTGKEGLPPTALTEKAVLQEEWEFNGAALPVVPSQGEGKRECIVFIPVAHAMKQHSAF
jgi:hypothetical protein